jgi:hypothetical protein
MDVDEANSFPHETVTFNEVERFLIACHDARRKREHEIENLAALRKLTARQLADHERVRQNIFAFERLRQGWNRFVEMVDPD